MFTGSHIFLICGSACCISCRHCMQYSEGIHIHDVSNENELHASLSEICVDFFVEWVKLDGVHCVTFWGGEPLIYFDSIRKAVELFDQLGIAAKMKFQIFTNGLLLSDVMVDFFNYYNFTVILSFDGPDETFLRSCVPDDSKIYLWQKIKNKRINGVISAGNPDIVKSLLYLKKKFNLDLNRIGLNFIRVHWKMDEDIYSFTDKDIGKMIDRVIVYENVNKMMISPWLHEIAGKINSADYFVQNFNYNMTSCGNGFSSLSIDFHGNVYVCHNSSIVLGKLSDNIIVLNQKRQEIYRKFIPKECIECHYFGICRIICPFALKNKANDEFVHCKYFKKIFQEILNKKFF